MELPLLDRRLPGLPFPRIPGAGEGSGRGGDGRSGEGTAQQYQAEPEGRLRGGQLGDLARPTTGHDPPAKTLSAAWCLLLLPLAGSGSRGALVLAGSGETPGSCMHRTANLTGREIGLG